MNDFSTLSDADVTGLLFNYIGQPNTTADQLRALKAEWDRRGLSFPTWIQVAPAPDAAAFQCVLIFQMGNYPFVVGRGLFGDLLLAVITILDDQEPEINYPPENPDHAFEIGLKGRKLLVEGSEISRIIIHPAPALKDGLAAYIRAKVKYE